MWELSLLIANAVRLIDRSLEPLARWRLILPFAVLVFIIAVMTGTQNSIVFLVSIPIPVAALFTSFLRKGLTFVPSEREFQRFARLSVPAYAAILGTLVSADWGFSGPETTVIENGLIALPPK